VAYPKANAQFEDFAEQITDKIFKFVRGEDEASQSNIARSLVILRVTE
jgi:hypothetical protein